MFKSILISNSPNTQSDDLKKAVLALAKFWQYNQGVDSTKLKNKLKDYLRLPHCYLLNSGRSALFLALKSLKLSPKNQVLHQGFTCSVVPQAIKKTKAQPVEIESRKDSFNLSIKDLKQKITPKTKALIIQHSFGVPDDIDQIKQICQQNNIVLIEDCAHSLGAEYKDKPVGSFADFTILSFGRDKVISSVSGGALLSRKKLDLDLSYPQITWTLKQLIHPLLIHPLTHYYHSFGKYLIFGLKKLKLITLPLDDMPVKKLPNSLAGLALHQFNKLDQLNQHRIKIAKIYAKKLKSKLAKGAIYLRYPVQVSNPDIMIKRFRQKNIYLGDWYDAKIINLPTHIKLSPSDAQHIINLLIEYIT
ncbi:aminotransferase class V-fold PLP-dependent enzyme [Patescibacteria group bacterium]